MATQRNGQRGMKKGKVFLVGAGPGDIGLLTIRGLRCLQRAEVVIYDNLCNPSLLHEVPRAAKIIFGGKHSGIQSLTQERIEQLMIRHASAGKTVVRLKGGDPFVFGRGAEEAAALRKKRINFEIVPGVTSAIAVPAYAGIPVTHRDHASGVAIVTAYEDPDKPESALDYASLAHFTGTLVFLMGVKRLESVAENLVDQGKPPQTPVALIRWGTRGMQQCLTGTLATIAKIAHKKKFRPPAVVVVGNVVRCRRSLKWFERRPLLGKRILVTRAREGVSALAEPLRELGAEVLELPTIEIQKIRSRQIQAASSSVGKFDWILFASPWAVDCFVDCVMAVHGDVRAMHGVRLGAIGPATAARIKERGMKVDLQPTLSTAEGFVAALKKQGSWKNLRVLLPRSEIGRDLLEKSLLASGARVTSLPVYRNVPPRLSWELDAVERVGADWAIFTSSSTATNYVALLKNPSIPARMRKILSDVQNISIGPTTSRTLRELGRKVHREARKPGIKGLVACLKSVG